MSYVRWSVLLVLSAAVLSGASGENRFYFPGGMQGYPGEDVSIYLMLETETTLSGYGFSCGIDTTGFEFTLPDDSTFSWDTTAAEVGNLSIRFVGSDTTLGSFGGFALDMMGCNPGVSPGEWVAMNVTIHIRDDASPGTYVFQVPYPGNPCGMTDCAGVDLEGISEYDGLFEILAHLNLLAPDADTVDEQGSSSFDVIATDEFGHDVTLTLSFTDLPPASYTWSDVGGSDSVGGSFETNPGWCEAGEYVAVFHAECTDGISAEDTVHITVNDVNRLPNDIVTVPACPLFFPVGSTGQVTITGFDADWNECGDDSLTIGFAGITPDSFLDHADGTADLFWNPDTADTGSYLLSFTVTDGYGEQYVEECSLAVGVHGVQIAVTQADTVDEGGTSAFEVSASCSQEHDLTLTLAETDLPAGSYSWTDTSGTGDVSQTFELHPGYCDAGSYTARFYAECSEGISDEDSVSVVILNVNRDPTVDGGSDQIVIPGNTLIFDVHAVDPDSVCGDTVAWTYEGYPFDHGATLGPGRWVRSFSWTPAETDTGTHEAIFAVDDGEAVHSDTVTITVSPHTLSLITIPDPPPSVVDEGSTLAFDVSAVDTDTGHTVTLTSTYLPVNATFAPDSGTGAVTAPFSLEPDYCQSGPDSAVFEASCSGGLVMTLTVQFTVTDVPRPPAIDADGPYSVKAGDTLAFLVEAADLDLACGDESLTMTSIGVPPGASFTQLDDTSGLFEWIPPEADTGDYPITFIVEDLTALADTDETIVSVVVFDFENVTSAAQVGDTGPGFGVAWGDYDGDGSLDVYIANYNQANVLYRNNGDGTFTGMEAVAGVAHTGPDHGAAWGDYDNDGDLDLYVSSEGSNQLYRNNGDGSFTDVTATAGVGNMDGGRGVAWADYDSDGDLDLYVANSFLTQPSVLYSNNGDGTFTDVANAAGVEFMGNGRGVAWGDYDNDGDPDLYVADYWPEGSALYRNNGDGTFTDVGESAGVSNMGLATGVAWGDYDNDGDLDLYVANYDGFGNYLYRNEGDGTFADATAAAEVGCVTDAFGTAWADYDSDGDLDLVVANYNEPNILYSNDGDGTFSDATDRAGIGDPGYGYGTAWGDYDEDGDVDLFIVNHDQPNLLYQNKTGGSDFLKIRTVGAAYLAPGFSNRDGVGARVEVRRVGDPGTLRGLREIRAGSGYCSMNSLEAEFGLDHSFTYDVQVTFPVSGIVRLHSDLSTAQTLVVYEERAPLPFSLLTPDDGDTVSTLTPQLVWHRSIELDPGDTVVYTVFYSVDSTFATQDSIAGLLDTLCTLPQLSDDTDYYWRVRGVDDYGMEAWSIESFFFHTYQPEAPLAFDLLSPPDQDTVFADTVLLDWEDALDPDPEDSVLYTLYYGTSPVFHPDSTTEVDSLDVSEYLVNSDELVAMGQVGEWLRPNDREMRFGAKPLGRELPDDVTIYWIVKAFDGFGLETWSSQTDWSFNVYVPEPPLAFNLISPADEETSWTLTPTLTWSEAADPDPGDPVTYTTFYTTDSTFTVQDSTPHLLDTTTTLPGLLDDSDYYWRVRATDRFGLTVWSAQTYTFHTYLVEAPLAFSLIEPVNGDTVYGDTVHLDWEDAFDPDPADSVLYDLWLSLHSDFSDPIIIDSLPESDYEFFHDTPVTTMIRGGSPERHHEISGRDEGARSLLGRLLHSEDDARSTAKSSPPRYRSLLSDTTYYWKVRSFDTWGSSTWSTETWQFYTASIATFIRGDSNSDMMVQMSDVVYTLQHLYVPGSPEPSCMDAADADDDGEIIMSDAVYTLRALYVPGAPPIPPPYVECGPDPTEDELDCSYHPCQEVMNRR